MKHTISVSLLCLLGGPALADTAVQFSPPETPAPPALSVPLAVPVAPAAGYSVPGGSPISPFVGLLPPFSPATNYMSLAGYLRWRTLLGTGRWMSREQSVEMAKDKIAATAGMHPIISIGDK